MREQWTADLLAKMHMEEVTRKDLADELGYAKAYVTQILNGTRHPAGARERLEAAFASVLSKRSK